MLKQFLTRNKCTFQNAIGTSWSGQVWRCLGHMSSAGNPMNPPRIPDTTQPSYGIVPTSAKQQSPETLNWLLSRLSLSPVEASATVQYTLPSRSNVLQTAILDPVAGVSVTQNCPTAVSRGFLDVPSYQRVDIYIDDPITDATVVKKASNILQKRHRKMKRHQYKKWRKRNRFKLRTQKQRRRKKKQERWERHLNRFRFTELKASEGEEFLEKKQEKLHLYLKYLGVDFDDSVMSNNNEQITKKKKLETMSNNIGSIIPKPLIPVGAR